MVISEYDEKRWNRNRVGGYPGLDKKRKSYPRFDKKCHWKISSISRWFSAGLDRLWPVSYTHLDKCFLFHGIGYKTSFYKALNYQLSEGIFYEDHEYSTIPCSRAESIIPFNIFLYEYLVGNSEQSVSVVNKLRRITHIEQVALRLSTHGNETYLTEAAREYVYRKAEVVILSLDVYKRQR